MQKAGYCAVGAHYAAHLVAQYSAQCLGLNAGFFKSAAAVADQPYSYNFGPNPLSPGSF